MTVAEFVIKYLETRNVTHMFTVVGGGCIFLSNELHKSNIKPIYCINEQGATIAAEAYGQLNKFGCALVTTGPGVTNALTGVAGAYLESTPMFIISGQVNTFHSREKYGVRQHGFQELDTPALATPVVKYYEKITKHHATLGSLQDVLDCAYRYMIDGRKGPVWIDIPLDVQNMEVNRSLKNNPVIINKYLCSLASENIDNLINDLQIAKKPVVLIGNGVRSSGEHSISGVKSFINLLGIPVLCTWKTFDMFTQDNPLYMGRPGIVTSRYANKIQQECDLFISLGARLDLGQTAFNADKIAPHAKKYIVEVDHFELMKNQDIPNTRHIHSSIEAVLKYIWKKVPGNKQEDIANQCDYQEWREYCISLKSKYSLHREYEQNSNFTYYKVLPELGKYLDEDTVLVHGSSGTCSEATCQALELHQPTRVIGTHGLGSMGFGLPAAIGAWFATSKKIICVDGDGSFAMNLQELSLIQKYKPDIHIIILNNGGYASIRNTQDKLFGCDYFGSSANDVLLPSYEKIANAYNITYIPIVNKSGLYKLALIKDNYPTIYEIFLDHDDIITYPRTQSKLINGKMTTLPMDQLWP